MNRLRRIVRATRLTSWLTVLAFAAGFAGSRVASASALPSDQSQSDQTQSDQSPRDRAQSDHGLLILTDSELPNAYPHRRYEFHFVARGGVSTLHWKIEKGALPPGLKLDDMGNLFGNPERPGEFQFTLSVTDGGNSQTAVQKGFVLRVIAALSLNWKSPPKVNGSRIEGTVEVTNTSPDDMDLTFVVMAVADNGRATAIGYQRFTLHSGTVAMELPFGENLPHGGYVIHADAVGEVAARNLIYRDRMQTPGPLQVTVGP